MSNTLNDISPNFRDYLLKRNLAFAGTIENNNLSSLAFGIGRTVSLDGDTSIQPSPNYTELEEQYRNDNISNNEFDYGTTYGERIASENESSSFSISNAEALKSNFKHNYYTFGDSMEQSDIDYQIIQQNSPNVPYVDSNGNLYNSDSADLKTFNVIGSFLSGSGVGLTEDGIDSNFDIKSTLIGRGLVGAGAINDTPLGQIQNEQLMLLLKNRVVEGTQRELLSKANLNPINLIKGGKILRPDYDITVGFNTFNKILKTGEDLVGFQSPVSKMDESSSIVYRKTNIDILEITKNQIKNTGKGQVKAMFDNLKENKYVPAYEDERTNDGPINKVGDKTKETYGEVADGFSGLNYNNTSTYETITPTKDSMLAKTKAIFEGKNNKMLLDKKGVILENPNEIHDGVNFNGTKIVSKGSGVKSYEGLYGDVDPDKVFGRVFTSKDAYDRVSKLQKNRGLANDNYKDSSVLGPNGFVKVSPYQGDGDMVGDQNNMKNFMFSLENLAWSDNTQNLPHSEIGPGDKITGEKGRIMWFPPYDITITDNNTANWETTNFVGRGEPVYTYNNSERLGTMSFKMIIDYPSYLEQTKHLSDDILHSIMAGVRDIQYSDLKNLSTEDLDYIKSEVLAPVDELFDVPQTEPDGFEIYFANREATYDSEYEKDGLNGFFTGEFVKELSDKLTQECPSCKVIIQGYSSFDEIDLGSIGNDRAKSFADFFKGALESDVENKFVLNPKQSITVGCDSDGEEIITPFAECKMKARRVSVRFEYDPTENEVNIANEKPKVVNTDMVLSNSVTSRFINEANYFKQLQETDPLVFEELKSKLDYFHPAFHSITPEGFNSRLNFLLQCTRQGPSQNENHANNLAFGKPPVCILRLGDFYHTKVVIDNVSFSFDPLVWDLNPEGVGVQPMICRVDLSYKMIGGSSLEGPINRLQNAVSFNYFGNTEVYDPRAASIVKKDGEYEYETVENLRGMLDGTLNMEPEPVIPPVDEEVRANSGDSKPEVVDDSFMNLKVIDFILNRDGSLTFFNIQFGKKDVNVNLPKMKLRLQIGCDEMLDVKQHVVTNDNLDTILKIDYDEKMGDCDYNLWVFDEFNNSLKVKLSDYE
jgi:hypothetical protein